MSSALKSLMSSALKSLMSSTSGSDVGGGTSSNNLGLASKDSGSQRGD